MLSLIACGNPPLYEEGALLLRRGCGRGRDVIFIRRRVEKAGMIWYNTPLMKSKQEVMP
ncbi:MAG: hypothetical protein V8T01_10540 [Oscillospiraceae bacterium]